MNAVASTASAWFLQRLFRDDARQVMAVLDAAAIPRLLPALAQAATEMPSLYLWPGDPAAELAPVAPWLVKLPGDTPLVRWIADLRGGSPGVFLRVDAGLTLRQVRAALSRFNIVPGPDGLPHYQRWYDPRVLPGLLARAEPADLDAWFAVVDEYLAETTQGAGLQSLRRGRNGLETASHAAPSAKADDPRGATGVQ